MGAFSFSPGSALRHFGFKQALRGAIIVGLLSGCMLIGQAVAYEKSYTTEASRTQFAKSLTAAPALGLLYGDAKNLEAGAKGYMVYRVAGSMSLVVAIWSLFAVTRLLRGSEEDGRWEAIRAGAIRAPEATWHVAAGFLYAWMIAAALSTAITVGVAAASGLGLAFDRALLVNLMIFLPGLLCAGVGIFTSQLATTRQRAVLYGILPVVVLFLLRGIANANADLHWLMSLTPFGWAELVNPILNPQPLWLLLLVALGGALGALGVKLAQRDLGSSLISQSDTERPHYYLLRGGWQVGLRQNKWIFLIYTTVALFITGLIAALSTLAIEATADSDQLSGSIGNLAGNGADIRVAFLGAGMVFLVMVLMIMSAAIMGALRSDEAKQYLDNILVGPHRRTAWLTGRLILGFTIIMIVSLLSGLTCYIVASHNNIMLDFHKVMAISVCLTGTIAFLMGLGTLIYGLLPRGAVIAMYAVMAWSFIIILISSVMHLNSFLLQSSLFHYTSFNLAASPQWATFGWTTGLGVVMAALGIMAFAKRDIIAE